MSRTPIPPSPLPPLHTHTHTHTHTCTHARTRARAHTHTHIYRGCQYDSLKRRDFRDDLKDGWRAAAIYVGPPSLTYVGLLHIKAGHQQSSRHVAEPLFSCCTLPKPRRHCRASPGTTPTHSRQWSVAVPSFTLTWALVHPGLPTLQSGKESKRKEKRKRKNGNNCILILYE